MRPYMTEVDAKGKLCPMQVGYSLLRNPFMAPCLASGCMWWGWKHEKEFVGGMLVNGRKRTALGRCEAPGGAA